MKTGNLSQGHETLQTLTLSLKHALICESKRDPYVLSYPLCNLF